MHLGILWAEQGSGTQRQVRKLVLGKAVESFPGSGVYVDKEVKWGWYNDAGTTRRWARACPDPASSDVFVTLVSLPSDADPVFRVGLPTFAGFDVSYTISVVRNSTGLAVSWIVVGTALSWSSAGPTEAYTVNLQVTLTKDNGIPSEFDTYQMASNTVAGSAQVFTDPRDPI
jgi:hypothetical protein